MPWFGILLVAGLRDKESPWSLISRHLCPTNPLGTLRGGYYFRRLCIRRIRLGVVFEPPVQRQCGRVSMTIEDQGGKPSQSPAEREPTDFRDTNVDGSYLGETQPLTPTGASDSAAAPAAAVPDVSGPI